MSVIKIKTHNISLTLANVSQNRDIAAVYTHVQKWFRTSVVDENLLNGDKRYKNQSLKHVWYTGFTKLCNPKKDLSFYHRWKRI